MKRPRFWVIVAGLAVTLLAHATVGAVFAAVITVTNTNDSGPGSLRQAIFDADHGDEINFDASLSGQTITLTTGQLLIEEDLTITGLGADQLTISGNKRSGVFENMSRVFEIAEGVTVTFSRLAMSDGLEYGENRGIGGGIKNSGTLTINDSTISGNISYDYASGGGIQNRGSVTIKNAIVANHPSGGNCFNSGTFNAFGANLSTDDTCPDFTQITPEALNLGPLADNGGPTQTQALLEGSVAIDAVSDCTLIDGVTPVETDQRKVPRPQGKACDIGAYEIVIPLLFTAVSPCRIVDTRRSGGNIGAFTQRNFHVFGPGSTISAQGANSSGCPSPLGQPLAAHINMVAVNPTGKGNLQAFPVGAGTGAGLSVNYNTIDTNLANAGTVKTVTGSGADLTVASNFSSAHTAIDVLGYYYPAP